MRASPFAVGRRPRSGGSTERKRLLTFAGYPKPLTSLTEYGTRRQRAAETPKALNGPAAEREEEQPGDEEEEEETRLHGSESTADERWRHRRDG
jgi:hypothetical protein